jgi:hypothetical protein
VNVRRAALSGQSILGGRTGLGRVNGADTGEVGNVPSPAPTKHHEIVIVGGGSGGAPAAARLCRKRKHPDVAVIEPLETHDYQPLWSLVAAANECRAVGQERGVLQLALRRLRGHLADTAGVHRRHRGIHEKGRA